MAGTNESDGDGDTYSECAGDCNETSAAIHPGATETCNGFDDNCDGSLDEGCDGLCDNPMKLGSDVRVSVDPADSRHPSLAWSGIQYAAAWEDTRDPNNREIYSARIDSGGARIGPEVRVTSSAGTSELPALVWTGSQYGVAWDDDRDGNSEIYFARLDAVGAKLAADVRVTNDPAISYLASLVWTGSQYGLAWLDQRSGGDAIYFARLDALGQKLGVEQKVSGTSASSFSLAWTGSEFGLAWQDQRDPSNLEIYFRRLDSTGAPLGSEVRVTNSPGSSVVPSLCWSGAGYGIAWPDRRDGNNEIYFARLDAAGNKIGSDVRITNDPANSTVPSIVWSGAEYGVTWRDQRSGNADVYFARIDASGAKIGTDVPITTDPGNSQLLTARAIPLVWSGAGYAASWYDDRQGGGNVEIYFAKVACCDDADGDGFDKCHECDDARASVHPGAPQICDGLNNDCNAPGWPSVAGTNESDDDGDTYSECSGDCDDAHSATHPGATEVNDGLDNQCSGEAGFGVIDEITGSSGFTTPGNNAEFCWPAQTSATLYLIVRSTSLDFSVGCTTFTTASTCFTDPEVPAAGGAFYYLVRAQTPHVGSWGQDSSGAERVSACGS